MRETPEGVTIGCDVVPIYGEMSDVVCSICDGGVVKGVSYYTATIPAESVGTRVKPHSPKASPAWPVRADGMVELKICYCCGQEMLDMSILTSAVV